MSCFDFTFDMLEQQYVAAIESGYEVITCLEYAKKEKELAPLTIVNRVDIDLSVAKAEILCDMFNRLDIKSTFFVRLHAPEYNPFSFENYRILKYIRDSGHEIGYHSEIVDQSVIWGEDAEVCLRRDLKVLSQMLDTNIHGIASHGGMTGLNNLDFWKNRKASDFGAIYEAYDEQGPFDLFKNSFYISDSEWTRWKCYDKGELLVNDRRTPIEHFRDKHPLIQMLIHPDTYYHRHIYE
jgi:hypothetical protein